MELHKVQNLLPEVPTALASAKLIGIATDTHPFVKSELFKYLRLDRAAPNVLNLFELTDEFATKLVSYQPFLDAVAQSEREIEEKFVGKVTPDIGVGITPIIVYGYAKMVARTYVESILKLEKDHPMPKSLQKNPRTFPSLFTYWFSYYFLYLTDQNVKVHKNDFNDLSLTLATPICQRFYTEKRLAHVLNEVKGYGLPSDRMVIDAASKNGTPSKTKQERRVELAFYSNAREKLLQRTSIYPFSKMLLHLKEQDKHLK